MHNFFFTTLQLSLVCFAFSGLEMHLVLNIIQYISLCKHSNNDWRPFSSRRIKLKCALVTGLLVFWIHIMLWGLVWIFHCVSCRKSSVVWLYPGIRAWRDGTPLDLNVLDSVGRKVCVFWDIIYVWLIEPAVPEGKVLHPDRHQKKSGFFVFVFLFFGGNALVISAFAPASSTHVRKNAMWAQKAVISLVLHVCLFSQLANDKWLAASLHSGKCSRPPTPSSC